MSDTKPWYTSKTVWAALATILVSVLGLFRRGVDPHFVEDFSGWAVSASTLVAGAIALYGRVNATKRISPPSGPPSTLKVLAMLGGTVWLLSSSGCAAPDAAFVRAERATYDAVAPEYAGYVSADPGLTADQKARRQRTLQTWDLSLRQQEARASTRPANP